MNKKNICFVIMPSGNHKEYARANTESDFIYKKIIIPAIKLAFGNEETEIIREADRRLPGAITKEIVKNVILADLVIVDITGQNPNVFFELGIRYALRRNTTILIRQETTDVPFDIAPYRCVTYDPHFHNDENSVKELADAIKSSMREKENRSDSLVFDTFPTLYIDIPGVLTSEQDDGYRKMMRWFDYWQQLNKIVDIIKDQFMNGRYVPSVIIGISNGGMMYADLLGRELFHNIPIVALWANRLSKDAQYFGSEINNSVIEGVRHTLGEKRMEILLVDDIVASGFTIIQALNYLSAKLPSSSISFLPLYCRNEKYFDNIRDNLIWFKDQFKFSEQRARELHWTDATTLPYDKDIRSS